MDKKVITESDYDGTSADDIIIYDLFDEDDEGVVVETEETIDLIEVDHNDDVDIDVSEGFGWTGGDSTRHYSLSGRDEDDQHPINSIIGLREELDEIERIKPVYSNLINIANYYQWRGSAREGHGYFVSLVLGGASIDVCDGHDIFGVTVDGAGFIGNQDESVPRNNSHSLVVTSGLVDVRCELDVKPGDYVVSNNLGCATKTQSSGGYRVIAVCEKYGVLYASIVLGVQACVTDEIGNDLNVLSEQIKTIEANTLTAVNTANSAFNKVNENENYFVSADKKAQDALDKADQVIGVTNNIGDVLTDVNKTATQAKAIAENAVAQATTLKDDAVKRANDAWAKADKVEKEAYSLCAKIDTYSVGEYSQAYGLTLEQAQSILEIGMLYVPTKHIDSETHKEQYAYGDGKVYEREFIPGYLYRWDYITGGDIGIGWVTVGSSMSVYFMHKEPVASGAYQYWYTDGDEIEDKNGSTGAYEPHTLYKWEDDHWLAVATLRGNANNRAISMISQTANSVSAEVTNARGDFASLDARITDEVSQVSMVATKLLDNGEINAAAIVASVNDSESNVAINANKIVLSGDTFFVDQDGNATTIDGSHITAGTVTANYIDSISGNIGGFKIGEKAIYNVHSNTVARINLDYYMTSPNTINNVLYMTEGLNNFVYLGNDGIGTMKIVLTDGQANDGYSALNTWMSNGEFFSNSGTIGGWRITAEGLRNTSESSGVIISDGLDCETAIKYGTIINRSTVESGNYAFYNMNELSADELLFTRFKDTQVRRATMRWCIEGEYLDPTTGNYIVPFRINADSLLLGENATYGELRGTWQLSSGAPVTSWSGAKHDIEPIDDRYSILFDNIEPVRFKYNNGQSDRYHTGFILEKLKMAMDTSEIDSSEFAAYCVRNEQTGEGGIRYEEIIALLVKEVQALKKEIKENG